MPYDLKDRVALVTGGARDIGRAIANKLASCGARVVVNYFSSADAAQETVAAIQQAGGRAVAVQADVTQSSEIEQLVRETRMAFGDAIHILVNNAGGLVGRRTIQEMDEAFWHEVLTLNLTSAFLVSKAVLPHMPEGGSIINLGSLAARNGGGPGSLAYATSKGGILTFTRGLAKELGPERKIRVNCISAGLIDTTFHDRFTPEGVRRSAVEGPILLRREGTAEDIGNAAAFLASAEADFITGESLEINGGMYFS